VFADCARKKDGSTRFCVDYRKLNAVTWKDAWPLPRLDTSLHSLLGSNWFSTLDLKSGYWQVELDVEAKKKTAFSTGKGLWQFKVMQFGLCNAPATFRRLMEAVLAQLSAETSLVYIDDIIVHAADFNTKVHNLKRVFQKLRMANLKLNPKKGHSTVFHLLRRLHSELFIMIYLESYTTKQTHSSLVW
jgi:hypothetical protein